MATSLKLVHGDTELWLRPATPSGSDPITTKSYNLGYPTARTVSQDAPGLSGTIDMTALTGARTVSLDVILRSVSGETKEHLLDVLKAAVYPANRPVLYLSNPEWSTDRRMVLRGNNFSHNVEQMSALFFSATLEFVCPSGFVESVEQFSSGDIVAPSGATAGKVYPIIYPKTYGSGTVANTWNIDYQGTVAGPPIIRMYGIAKNPAARVIYPDGSSSSIVFGGTIGTGDYLEINVANQTAYMNSEVNYYGLLNQSKTKWWTLQPGMNKIAFDADSAGEGAMMQIFWRELYL